MLKTERFLLRLSREYIQKYSQEGFFRLTYVEPKHQSDSPN